MGIMAVRAFGAFVVVLFVIQIMADKLAVTLNVLGVENIGQ